MIRLQSLIQLFALCSSKLDRLRYLGNRVPKVLDKLQALFNVQIQQVINRDCFHGRKSITDAQDQQAIAKRSCLRAVLTTNRRGRGNICTSKVYANARVQARRRVSADVA